MWQWLFRKDPDRGRDDFWRKAGADEGKQTDGELSVRLCRLAKAVHPNMSVRVDRTMRGHRLIVLQGNGDSEAIKEALLLYRRTDRSHRGSVVHEHTPAEWMRLSFDLNREFYEGVSVGQVNWPAHPMVGEIGLSLLDRALTCRLVGRPDLAVAWHATAKTFVAESRERLRDAGDVWGLQGAYLALAQRVWLVMDDGSAGPPDEMLAVPYDAYPREIESLARGSDMDCGALICCLQAVMDRDRGGLSVARGLVRKREPDTSRERRLVRKLDALLEGDGDEDFWKEFGAVLTRWLDPVVFTESEAYLFRDPLRHGLALTWLTRRLKKCGPDAYLNVLCGAGAQDT